MTRLVMGKVSVMVARVSMRMQTENLKILVE